MAELELEYCKQQLALLQQEIEALRTENTKLKASAILRDCNPLKEFLDAYTKPSETVVTTYQEIYAAFYLWCKKLCKTWYQPDRVTTGLSERYTELLLDKQLLYQLELQK